LHVELLGPASHQPGAPTPFRLATQTPDGQPTAAHVTVRVLGRAAEHEVEHELLHEEYDSSGDLRFLLPATLAVQPGQSPRLIVEAKSGTAKEVVEHEFVVEEPTYLTHVALNKLTYGIGEVVFFRTVTLDRFALAPIRQPLDLTYSLCQVVDGKLVSRKQLHGTTEQGGIGGGELALTDDLPEGDFCLLVSADKEG